MEWSRRGRAIGQVGAIARRARDQMSARPETRGQKHAAKSQKPKARSQKPQA